MFAFVAKQNTMSYHEWFAFLLRMARRVAIKIVMNVEVCTNTKK